MLQDVWVNLSVHVRVSLVVVVVALMILDIFKAHAGEKMLILLRVERYPQVRVRRNGQEWCGGMVKVGRKCRVKS